MPWIKTPRSERLLVREFDDGAVAYDTLTGETTQLSSLSCFVMAQLMAHDRALGSEELTRLVLANEAEQGDGECGGDVNTDPADAQAALHQTMAALQRAGLVSEASAV